jgi:predicted amidohydrolase
MKAIVAVGQMTSTSDIETNLAVSQNLVAQARLQGASLVCLPENCAFMSSDDTNHVPDNFLERYQQVAKDNQIWVSLGGFPISSGADGRIHNTHIILDDQGHIRARYQKAHLFSVDIKTSELSII